MPTRSSYFSEIALTPLFVLLMCAMVKQSSQIHSKPSPDECLRKCGLAREESFITKVTRFLSCYHICLNGNKEDRPALSEIISRLRTRKALSPANCPDSSKNQSVKWKPSKVNVSFGQYENTSSWYVNVSWNPINETHENCTGILVRLVVPAEDSFGSFVHCSIHPRNQTFLRRNISQYNYHYPNHIFVNILALPYPSDFSGELHPFAPNIPTSPSPTATTTTSPSPSASECFNEYGDLVWYPSEVNADFFLQGSVKDWYANISWTPLTDPTVTWTGYLITVFVGDISVSGFSTALQCFKLSKNQTYIIVDSSEGWEYPKSISVNVTAYPRPRLEMADLKYFSPVKHTVKYTVKIPDSPEPVSASPNPTTGKLNVVKVVFGSVGGFAVVVLLLIAVWFIRRHTCGEPPTVVATDATKSRKSFKHHAFIIYSMFDSEWVDNTLIPRLESYGFNCCVHWKDFLPGKAYTENIVESVYNSFKIIAVISSHFMDSKPCEFELQHAMTRQMNNRDDCLIVIKLDDAGVQRLPISILNNSYIDFTRDTDRSTWESKLAVVLNEAVVEDDSSRTSTTSTKDNNNRLSEGSSTASESRDLICSCQSV